MKRFWNAFVMCQSMFCALPCPFKGWDEKARSLQLLFLPVIGLEIGVMWALAAWLLSYFQLPFMVRGIGICAYPFLITGFIHLDGFMDVCDAVRSWRSLERRREILKDSLVGAFSVISVVLLIVAQFAFSASIPEHAEPWPLLFIPVVSRCCAGLAVTGLPAMSTSQYAGLDGRKKIHLLVLSMMLLLTLVAGAQYIAVLLGCIAGYGVALVRAYRSLKGMNGDISGYALTIGELCGVAVYALL